MAISTLSSLWCVSFEGMRHKCIGCNVRTVQILDLLSTPVLHMTHNSPCASPCPHRLRTIWQQMKMILEGLSQNWAALEVEGVLHHPEGIGEWLLTGIVASHCAKSQRLFRPNPSTGDTKNPSTPGWNSRKECVTV